MLETPKNSGFLKNFCQSQINNPSLCKRCGIHYCLLNDRTFKKEFSVNIFNENLLWFSSQAKNVTKAEREKKGGRELIFL